MFDYYEKNLYNEVKEFYEIYKERPIKNNMGGMLSPHLFNTWYILKQLKPKLVIESGVWKGLGTWTIEKALPEATIICLDVNFSNLVYSSNKAIYINEDISSVNWEKYLKNFNVEEEVVIFLDDHQNFLARLDLLKKLKIKKILFEDNYPPKQGDCLSPKKILAKQNFVIDSNGKRTFYNYLNSYYEYFDKYVSSYEEMPPIFKLEKTRWNDSWNDIDYPTKKQILDDSFKQEFPIFYDEAEYYTWICYMNLK